MVEKPAELYLVSHPETPHDAGDFPPVIGEVVGAYRETGFVAADGFPGTQKKLPLGTLHIGFEERDGKIEITNHFI
jgi:hypothetical protein